jgi:hypothetical protein
VRNAAGETLGVIDTLPEYVFAMSASDYNEAMHDAAVVGELAIRRRFWFRLTGAMPGEEERLSLAQLMQLAGIAP